VREQAVLLGQFKGTSRVTKLKLLNCLIVPTTAEALLRIKEGDKIVMFSRVCIVHKPK
jgi:hypothetical protein